MISVDVDLSSATPEEVEFFFTLPHVAHAVDVLVHGAAEVVTVRLLDRPAAGLISMQARDSSSEGEPVR